MRQLMNMSCALLLSLGWGLLASSSTAYAQACGCGKTQVLVGDEEGEAVKGVTIEFLNEEGFTTLFNCGDKTLAKQSGNGRKFKFRVRSFENGGNKVLLMVTAPGYVTYEEKGPFLKGCYIKLEVLLRKTGLSHRVGYAAPNNGMHPMPRHAASHGSCVGARVMPGDRPLQ